VLFGDRVTIGNTSAGSSGLTRSLRSDYENPTYAGLAKRSWVAWLRLQTELGEPIIPIIVRTGCVNLSKKHGSDPSYAQSAAQWLKRDGSFTEKLIGADKVTARFPQFSNFDFAVYEETAGLGLALKTLAMLQRKLRASSYVSLRENFTVEDIRPTGNTFVVAGERSQLRAKKLIIAAGLGTPRLLQQIDESAPRLPLSAARPTECLYYIPKDGGRYIPERLPVFAYLDKGIYGHPIVAGVAKGVKIGYYHPPATVNSDFQSVSYSIAEFVREHMPELASNSIMKPVRDTDQCAYDMTPDEGFMVGTLARQPNVFVACGFCGTGYKFAPVIADLMQDFGTGSAYHYDSTLFDPDRFTV
jgi:glycine/D-amino acid oxidase-like deaminating enzyme